MKTTYNELLKLAQNDLESKLSSYYERNEDGGTTDEIYSIAFRVAKRFEVELSDLNY